SCSQGFHTPRPRVSILPLFVITPQELIKSGYDQYMSELPPRSPSDECYHFLEIYHGILHHKIDQEDIRLEPGMQERIINAARQAFNVWSNTRRSSEANSSSNSSSARIHSQPSLLSGSYQVVPVPK